LALYLMRDPVVDNFREVNYNDAVPHYPPQYSVFGEYRHTGILIHFTQDQRCHYFVVVVGIVVVVDVVVEKIVPIHHLLNAPK